MIDPLDDPKGEEMKGLDKTAMPSRRLELTSSAVGGALVAGAIAGAVGGPVVAVVAAAAGGVAGELFDRYADARSASASDKDNPHPIR